MNTVAVLPAGERTELFRETAARRGGVAFQLIEKDFWVSVGLLNNYSICPASALT